MAAPTQADFEQLYARGAPWEIGRPQSAFVGLKVAGRILDVGCGTGELALHFAALGYEVTGIDFAEPAIEAAKQKAETRGLSAEFILGDALTMPLPAADTILDSGLLHVLGDSQSRYIERVANALVPGGLFIALCFAGDGTGCPERMTAEKIKSLFADWESVTVAESAYELTMPAGLPALLATARRGAQ